jgi:hypothetical protein
MPNCFQLTRKGDSSPAKLQDIDRAICQNLDIPFSEDKWAANWYANIGLFLALGKSFNDIIDLCWDINGYEAEHANLTLRIAAYLNDNYTSDAWYQHGW